MGLFYKYLPFECLASFVCLINLGGLPFTYGFFIKHYLFVVFNYTHWIWFIVWLNALLASFTGIFYSYRLFYYVFFDFKKSKKAVYFSANRIYFKSTNYTNSSVASMFSISLFSDFNRSVDFSSRLNVFSHSEFFLFNFFSTSFNTFFFYFFIFFVFWRYSFKSITNLKLFFVFLSFCFFSFVFWSIL